MVAITTIILTGGLAVGGAQLYQHYRQRPGNWPKLHTQAETIWRTLTQNVWEPLTRTGPQTAIPASKNPEPALTLLETHQEMQLRLAISAAAVSLATAGVLFYAPLLIVSVPITLASTLSLYKESYQALTGQRRLGATLLDTAFVSGVMIGGFYFVGAVSVFFDMLSRYLLFKTQLQSQTSVVSLFREQPRRAWLLVEGVETEVDVEALQVGDTIVVNAGQTIPVDGMVTSGSAMVDQQSLTGEAQPVEKSIGDTVFLSTLVLRGKIHLRVEKTGDTTVAAQIGEILHRTADFRTTIQTRAESNMAKLTLPMLAASSLTLPFYGPSSALAVLGNTPGYKLTYLAPMSLLNFLDLAARHGILVKDGRTLERLGQVNTIVFDKTGTLTLEQPQVKKIYCWSHFAEDELLRYAAAVEARQTHPIAKAILSVAQERMLDLPVLEEADYTLGFGIKARLADQVIHIGSDRFMQREGIPLAPPMRDVQTNCAEQGHSLVLIAIGQQVAGAIELQPQIRPEAPRILQSLRQRGLALHLLSGDQEPATHWLAQTLQIEQVHANILPERKAALIEQLQERGQVVCFVGDGINDAIALKKADVSISLRGAATIATDTAQIVLMDASLQQLTKLFELTDEFAANARNNYRLSVTPAAVCISGVYLLHWGLGVSLIISPITTMAGFINTAQPRLRYLRHRRDAGVN